MTSPPPTPPPPRRPDRDGRRPAGPAGGGDPAWADGGTSGGAGPADAFRVPFSVLDGFLAVLWMLLAQFVVVTPAVLLGVVDPAEGGPSLLLVVVTSQAVGLAGLLAWLGLRGRLSWRLIGPARPRWSHLPLGLAVGLGGFLAVNLVLVTLIAILGPVDPPEQRLLRELTTGGVTTLLTVVAAIVMAPVLEEVVFRGVLFQALRRRAGLWPAVVFSSLLFAAIHVEITQPLFSGGLLLLGVLFALVQHRVGNLLVPIVGHAAFNAVAVALTLLGADTVPHA